MPSLPFTASFTQPVHARSAGLHAEPVSVSTLSLLLHPRSIAVVGVRGGVFDPAARNSMARRFVENLQRHGYAGAIYPVHPRYDAVGELTCYPSLDAIPGQVDAALLILPKEQLAASLHACAAKGVRAVTVISSGFSESGSEGKADELELVAIARSHGMRLLGPNCFGYLNSHDSVNLFGSASLLTRPLLRGSIGFVTQSGALAAAILDRAQERGIGFSHLITTGNQADIHNAECLDYLVEDPRTRVITLFAEAIGDAPRFRAAMQRAARAGKPCVVLKSGASEVARASALAHTGSLVGDDAVYDAVFRQDGVVRVNDPDALFLTAALLAQATDAGAPGAAARVAVISMSGAMGGILADIAAQRGVVMAPLDDATCDALRAVPGIGDGARNPLDAAMATWFQDFDVVGVLAGILAADAGVDVVVLAISGLPYAERLVDDCAAAVRQAGKVFVPMWAADRSDLVHAVPRLAHTGITVFETCDSAMAAIAALGRFRLHQAALQTSTGGGKAPVAIDATRRAQALVLLAGSGRTLTEHASKQLLALYGVPIALDQVATSAEGAVRAAEAMGYPVALKVHSADIAHKTEADALRLGLADAAAVREAFEVVVRNAAAYEPHAVLGGVLVAPMAPRGIEVVAGAYRDAQFGPVLMVGLGGIHVEVLRDVAMCVAPLDAAGARAMLGELRAAALFDGVRGQPAADKEAVVHVLLSLSELMLELADRVDEIDVNPLIVHRAGTGATVADALVVLREAS